MDREGNSWYKGNLHTHTTRSDGRFTPEEAITLYKGKGYDFMALTDHWAPTETEESPEFLILSGCEYDIGVHPKEGIFHVVGVGFDNTPSLERSSVGTAQDIIDGIKAAGGIAILAHPAWSLNRINDIMTLEGLSGLEIYNSVSGRPWNARPYSGGIVDGLALEGKLLPCMAADDAHFYNGDETLSYIMVKARSLNRLDILKAMARGDFYATQGPELHIEKEGNTIKVSCSPVSEVVFLSDSLFASDRVTRGNDITEAVYKLKLSDNFVRVELLDSQGRMAWSSPIKVR